MDERDGLRGAVRRLNANDVTYTTVDLRYCSLGNSGCTKLAKALAKSQYVESLQLASNDIGDEGLLKLLNAIPSSVTNLDFSFNKFGVDGAKALIKLVECNPQIVSLIIFGNSCLDGESALKLTKLVEKNRSSAPALRSYDKISRSRKKSSREKSREGKRAKLGRLESTGSIDDVISKQQKPGFQKTKTSTPQSVPEVQVIKKEKRKFQKTKSMVPSNPQSAPDPLAKEGKKRKPILTLDTVEREKQEEEEEKEQEEGKEKGEKGEKKKVSSARGAEKKKVGEREKAGRRKGETLLYEVSSEEFKKIGKKSEKEKGERKETSLKKSSEHSGEDSEGPKERGRGRKREKETKNLRKSGSDYSGEEGENSGEKRREEKRVRSGERFREMSRERSGERFSKERPRSRSRSRSRERPRSGLGSGSKKDDSFGHRPPSPFHSLLANVPVGASFRDLSLFEIRTKISELEQTLEELKAVEREKSSDSFLELPTKKKKKLGDSGEREKERGEKGEEKGEEGKREGLIVNEKNVVVSEKISRHGRADVYCCYVDGWKCAMKEIRLDVKKGTNPKSLLSEIQILTKLPPHRNVVRYLFSSQSRSAVRLFMTSYDSTLTDKIQERQQRGNCQFSVQELARFMMDIARGLQFLHHHHVVHRDLKPSNIFVTLTERQEIGSLVLGDFDAARVLEEDKAAKSFVGTPLYMAPEMMKDIGCSFPTDIFGAGLLLFEMMTLQHPHSSVPRKLIPQKIIDGERPTLPDDLPSDYEPLIELFVSCTHADPKDRIGLLEMKEKLLLLA